MATKRDAYVPAMADEAVQAKTSKTWSQWFTALDKAGAKKLDHKAIATLLSEQHGIPGWWCQTVTVEYERSRGLREPHQKGDGYSIGVSKTIAVSLPQLYEATADASQRKKWFPKGAFELSSQTPNKYLRGAWNGTARLEMGFYAKGADKSQIALQVNKLAKQADVEAEREAWKAAVAKLQKMLEG